MVSLRRGQLVPLTIDQVVTRALYLAGERTLDDLDEYVRKDVTELRASGYQIKDGVAIKCPDLFYLLHEHNGGKDPCAPDPADRWSKPGSTFQNRTVDCSGGNAWMQGFDRYQPDRFAHIYSGWINTDSKILDAEGKQKCFAPLSRPEPGCIITCASKSYGHRIGHEGTVVAVHCLEWDPARLECWQLVDVVDCAARSGRSNKKTTARGWFGAKTMFLRNVMRP